ncbi:MAG: serine/threonine-protein kinase [Gemmataceae bacterium]
MDSKNQDSANLPVPPTVDISTPNPDSPTVPLADAVWPSAEVIRLQSRYGPYEVRGLLGRGGMGVVYRARHVFLGRDVAIKLLRHKSVFDDDMRRRFLTEGAVVAGFDHPNIVRVYDYGEERDEPYCAMELLDGGSLALLLTHGPLEPRAAATLIAPLARAVQYAHDRRVMHCDLKPANILLSRSHDSPSGLNTCPSDSGSPALDPYLVTPKVADFGLAHFVGSTDHEDCVFGTVNYMAPEQAQPGQPVGPAVDVYGLGAILYECLTGKLPVQTDQGQLGVSSPVSSTSVRPPSQVRAGLPPELDKLCQRCLANDPSTRPANAAAVADALQRFLDGSATPLAAPRGRIGRFLRNHAVGMALMLLAMAAFGAAFAPDPGRDIRSIEARIARGERVQLIGERGLPVWHAVRYAPQDTQVSVSRAKPFEVGCWDYTLIELLSDPYQTHYRLTAEVCQLQSDETGAVGVYIARRSLAQGEFVAQSAVIVNFSDLYQTSAQSPSNPLRQDALLQAMRDGNPYASETYSGPYPTFFQPAGFSKPTWRTIGVDVTPAGILATIDGRGDPNGSVLRFADLERNFAQLRNLHPLIAKSLPPTERFPVRGGLGLFVRHASAAFRNVAVGPLPAPPPS